MTTEEALQLLLEGNRRFVAGHPTNPNCDARRRAETARDGQHPFAAVLGCSDSRVPPELIFDRGIGELFVIRVAGNVAGTDQLGSLEYVAEHLHIPLIVVLGHTHCGAVHAVVEQVPLGGFLRPLAALIHPAVARARAAMPGADGAALRPTAERENIWQSVAAMLNASVAIRSRIQSGKLEVVGALYHLDDGRVEWLGPHPDQEHLLRSTGADKP